MATSYLSPLSPQPNEAVGLGNLPAPATIVNLRIGERAIYNDLYNFLTTTHSINCSIPGYLRPTPIPNARWTQIAPLLATASGRHLQTARSTASAVSKAKSELIGLLMYNARLGAAFPVAAPVNASVQAPQVAPGAAGTHATLNSDEGAGDEKEEEDYDDGDDGDDGDEEMADVEEETAEVSVWAEGHAAGYSVGYAQGYADALEEAKKELKKSK